MSRANYLETATALAYQPGVDGLPESPHLAARVGVADVASATGLSRAYLYRLWGSQYEFLLDLLRYLTFEGDFAKSEYEMPWNVQHAPLTPVHDRIEPADTDAYLVTRYNEVLRATSDSLRILTRAASIGYPESEGVAAARQRAEAIRFAASTDDVVATVEAMGRAFVPPMTELGVSCTTWWVADGLSVLSRFIPERCTVRLPVDFGSGEHEWSLLALAARAMYIGASTATDDRPARPPSPPPEPPDTTITWTPQQFEVLSTASDLFFDSIGRDDEICALPHVTIARVAALAEVSRRAVYNLWPSRDDMMIDVLDNLLATTRRTMLACWRPVGRFGIDRLTGMAVGPVIPPGSSDPLLAFATDFGHERCRTTVADSMHRLLSELTESVVLHLATMRRQPRPGLEPEHLALIWVALVGGARRLRRTSPRLDADPGAAAAAIFEHLTLPV